MKLKNINKSDTNYPKTLLKSKYAPELLYYIGDISILNNCIAVIGKRDVSERILKISYNIGEKLASQGYIGVK